MLFVLFVLIVLPRLGFTSVVECQGCVSEDRFYYNYNVYNRSNNNYLIHERPQYRSHYYAIAREVIGKNDL